MQNDPNNPNQNKSTGSGQNPRTQSGSGTDRQGAGSSSSNPGSGDKRQFSGVRGRDEQIGDASSGRATGNSTEITGFLDAIEENCTKLRAALRGREDGSEQQVPAPWRGAGGASGSQGKMDADKRSDKHADKSGRDDTASL